MKALTVNPWAVDSPWLNPDKEARKNLQEARRRQFLEDLAETLKTPCGLRLIIAYLRRLRLGEPLTPGEGAAVRHNLALALLRDCGAASPNAQKEILLALFAPEEQ